ncbi:general transcriptional corepressor trfA-like [Gossypium australe]|uniref:General transcriptional corepressor trfA-like n=1 Tax=Gossypium australe TaxID=47621 RepID=A0A5B6V4G6_9ROSI|nr:general transcriptional corepressor trfA-like [Gossypium australe]
MDEVEFLNVNLPLIELIEKILKYTKYLKEIMARCRKIKRGEPINIDASCSAIITRKIPPKLKIRIGDIHFCKALCDLGANINLMPFLIYKKLELGKLKNTNITLQLADKSSVQPKGVLEDVLVKVCNFIIPVDFVILYFEEDREISILLGRPFLATSRSIIGLEIRN